MSAIFRQANANAMKVTVEIFAKNARQTSFPILLVNLAVVTCLVRCRPPATPKQVNAHAVETSNLVSALSAQKAISTTQFVKLALAMFAVLSTKIQLHAPLFTETVSVLVKTM